MKKSIKLFDMGQWLLLGLFILVALVSYRPTNAPSTGMTEYESTFGQLEIQMIQESADSWK